METEMNESLSKFKALVDAEPPLRWVFAGDSITHGAAHTMGWRDYTEIVSERVRWEIQRRRDCIIKTGISGWRITDLANDLEWSALQHRPHVLSLNFGANDCTAGPDGRDAFTKTYLEVIGRCREALGCVIVIHTPNRFLPADEVRFAGAPEYACAIREIAGKTGAILVDHFADWEALDKARTTPFYLSDAIHPNECGHRMMAKSLLKTLGLWDETSRVGRLFLP